MIKVAQCWDDGVATDIRLVEILRKYNAKATFNLCPGAIEENTVKPYWLDQKAKEWSFNGFHGGRVGRKDLRAVYDGFQVASHCMMHECAGIVPDAEFLKSAVDARNFLEDTFQQPCRGFAWPCGRHTAETENLLAEAGFAYGRTVGNTSDLRTNKNMMVLDSSCHFHNPMFWKIFEDAKDSGVFYFWGHSYEMMEYPTLWERFEEKIKLLSEDPEVEWVDVVDIVEILKQK